VPLFLVALLIVRGLPALLYRRSTGTRHAVAAGLLQATTLTFIIVATQIGLATGKITPTQPPRCSPRACSPQPCSRARPSGCCPGRRDSSQTLRQHAGPRSLPGY